MDISKDVARFVRYDPHTGKLFWESRSPLDFKSGKYPVDSACKQWNLRYANKEAFTATGNTGYKVGAIKGKNYLAHRIAWVIVTGSWPIGFIDHINGVRTDNRWDNLRDVSCLESAQNLGLRVDNNSGCTGVFLRESGRWSARIMVSGEYDFLGTFDSFEDARQARKEAEAKYGFHKNYGTARQKYP